ncbi:MAG: hypothetical protein F9K40_05705 [Kofleriaceae bacterium]|nr:MAG: hypothetical protein F9K40_05705 [Kofleriaceae bacterium]
MREGPHVETTTVRFFTSAALRPHEEVAGEVSQWLPRWIAVEHAGSRPVCGVWQSAKGLRRICWYAREHSSELVQAHLERYGDEPFWIIDVSTPDGPLTIIECERDGRPQARRGWTFDEWYMPVREEERSPDGVLVVTREYDCVHTGVVVGLTERRPGLPDVEHERPIRFPAELAGEPYPCGRTITNDGPRLIEPIAQNQFQGRFYAAYQDGPTWKRGIATIATSRYAWPHEIDPIVAFDALDVAPLVKAGELVPRWRGNYPMFGVVEALPEGRTLDDVVAEDPLELEEALRVAIQLAGVARRAHAEGLSLGAIRPELVYLRREETRWTLSGVIPRGQAVIDATYSGEGVRVPPVFPCDFSSANDTRGLAALLWYALTGGHPYVAPADVPERRAWSDHERGRARRQPWTGPPSIGPLLERVLFESGPSPDFESFISALVQQQMVLREP